MSELEQDNLISLCIELGEISGTAEYVTSSSFGAAIPVPAINWEHCFDPKNKEAFAIFLPIVPGQNDGGAFYDIRTPLVKFVINNNLEGTLQVNTYPTLPPLTVLAINAAGLEDCQEQVRILGQHTEAFRLAIDEVFEHALPVDLVRSGFSLFPALTERPSARL
ncbi:MAG: hypothetical protein WAO98_06240 [Alphaproteobacteria bacterium]